MAHRVAVVEAFGQLERPLGVLLRRGPVSLPLVAARTPLADVRAEPVGRNRRTVREVEGLRVERQRRGDRVQLEAAAGEVVEDVRPVDVREHRLIGDGPGSVEDLDRLPDLAQVHARPGLGENRAQLELGRGERREDQGELRRARPRPPRTDSPRSPPRPRDHALDALALARRDPDLEERRVDAELRGQPIDRLGGRPRLAALDLADVLLREARAGEVGLSQPAGDAKLAHPLAQGGAGGGGKTGERGVLWHGLR